jgi:6-phosphogluconolactonase (cycloisomerase 2 family)
MRVLRPQAAVLGAVLCAAAGCGHGELAVSVPRYAYVLGSDGAVSGYAVNPRTGQLRPNGYALAPAPIEGLDLANSLGPALAVSDAGYVYMVAPSSSALPVLTTFAVEASTGILRPRPTIPRPGPSPQAIAAHPSGKFVYIVTARGRIQPAGVDAPTGTLADIGADIAPPGVEEGTATLSRVAVDPQGRFLLAAERDTGGERVANWLVAATIDPGTGALDTAWSRSPIPFEAGAVAIHPGGRCGLAAPRSQRAGFTAFSVSRGGDLSAGPVTAGRDGVVDLAVDPTGRQLLVLDRAGVLAFEITNAETCALGPPRGPLALDWSPTTALSIDPSGRFAYVTASGSDRISTLSIDGSSGVVGLTGEALARPRSSGFAPVFTHGARAVNFAPRFLYAANFGSDDVSVYGVNWTTGALTLKGSQSSLGSGPLAVAVDPWGRFAFVANATSGTVASFVINTTTGALARVSVPSPVGARPVALAVDPSGRFLYVASEGGSQIAAFVVDQTSGEIAAVFGSPFPVQPAPSALAVDPTGVALYATSASPRPALSSFLINEVVGAIGSPSKGLPIEGSGAGHGALGIDVTGGLLFLAEDLADAVSLFRPARAGRGGDLERMARAAAGSRPTSVAIDPEGRFVYAAGGGGSGVSTFTYARNPGAVSRVGTFGDGTPAAIQGIAADPSGRFVYAADAGAGAGAPGRVLAFAVAPENGALTSIGSVPAGRQTSALAVARYHE